MVFFFQKLFWPTMWKKSTDQKELFQIQDWRLRIFKYFEITRTIYSNSKRSGQFLKHNTFLTLWVTFWGIREYKRAIWSLEYWWFSRNKFMCPVSNLNKCFDSTISIKGSFYLECTDPFITSQNWGTKLFSWNWILKLRHFERAQIMSQKALTLLWKLK